jgi:peptidoglycan/LPS O-acetylase OafA/YrhL
MVSDIETSKKEANNYSASYMPTIDGLRGIAILLVLWYHAPFLFREVTALPENIFWRMSTAGWIGVDLFFVISGFLITGILLRNTMDGSLQAFWYRRGLRILPLAILYLLLLQLNVIFHDPLGILTSFEAWSAYLFYMGNVHIALSGWQPLVIMILWSLAVEEQFYLLWPVLVHHISRRHLLILAGLIIGLSPLARSIVDAFYGYPAVYVLTLCRLDVLSAGAVLALLLSSEEWSLTTSIWCRKLAFPAMAFVLVTFLAPFSPSFASTHPTYFTLFGYTWIALALAILVGVSVRCEGLIQSILSHTALTFIGKRCYGFYLWHVVIAAVVTKFLSAISWNLSLYGRIAMWSICLSLVVTASWYFFERPILNLKYLCSYPVDEKERSVLPGTQLARVNI